MIDFSEFSVGQLCAYYNHINRDVVDTKMGYHQQKNSQHILDIKKLLVHRGHCSPIVLEYEGKL
jgi:hypothetical protein